MENVSNISSIMGKNERTLNLMTGGVLGSDFLPQMRQVNRMSKTFSKIWQDKKLYSQFDGKVPNGYDYLLFSKPWDKEDFDNLSKLKSSIKRVGFHQVMKMMFETRNYIENFLMISKIKKSPSPERILSRLNDFDITGVASSKTHLLTFEGKPNELVVHFGADFLDSGKNIITDEMNLLYEVKMAEPERLTGHFLTPGKISPVEVLKEFRNEYGQIGNEFPGYKELHFSGQMINLFKQHGDAELVMPTNGDDFVIVQISDAVNYLTNEFTKEGWEVGRSLS